MKTPRLRQSRRPIQNRAIAAGKSLMFAAIAIDHGRADCREERQHDLRLADHEAPRDRERQDAERKPRVAAPKPIHQTVSDEAREHHHLPDRSGGSEREQGKRPEQDRKERRVWIPEGGGNALVGRIEGQPGVQAPGRPVVGLDVVERIGRDVEPEHVDAGEGPDDRQREQAKREPAGAGRLVRPPGSAAGIHGREVYSGQSDPRPPLDRPAAAQDHRASRSDQPAATASSTGPRIAAAPSS